MNGLVPSAILQKSLKTSLGKKTLVKSAPLIFTFLNCVLNANESSKLVLVKSVPSRFAESKVTSFRSSFGAVENRIDASINNLTTLKVNTEAAKSRIEDADFAQETSQMTKSQILSQAATSMLAQANASKQNLLALLQG